MPEYDPTNLLFALRRARSKAVPSEGMFLAALTIDCEDLSDTDKANLEEAFVGSYFGDIYYHWIADNQLKPIHFSSAVIASENAEQQRGKLESRLLYDLYRRTGLKYNPLDKNAVQII